MTQNNPQPDAPFDFAIIGSGFGGSVWAMRLVEKRLQVAVTFLAPERFSR